MKSGKDDFREFLRLVREGLATPEVLAALHELIRDDREALREYVRTMHFQASLYWLMDGRVPGDEAVRAAVRQQVRRWLRVWLWRSATAVAAAIVLIAAGLWSYFTWSVSDIEVAPVVGQVQTLRGQYVSAGRSGGEGMVLRAGQEWGLLTGVAEFRFDNDARVTVEAPATLRIDAVHQISLQQGKLVVEAPPRATGFTVQTPTAKAVDLGTQFGVVVDPNGAPEFHVLKGEVRAVSSGLSAEVLHADQASRYSIDGNQRQSMPASRDVFNACLRLSAGIVDFRGEALFAARPVDTLDARGNVRPDFIHVFLERHDFRLPRDVEVLSVEEGRLEPSETPSRVVLPAGTVVDVYFAHLQVDSPALRRCQMTFARPLAGVLIESEALDATDDLFAVPKFSYMPPGRKVANRGAVFSPGSAGKTQDRLNVSDDRRSITIQFEAQTSDIDQVRILVPVDPKGNSELPP